MKEERIYTLATLRERVRAEIVALDDEMPRETRRRLLDLGFIRGAEITVENRSPAGNPIAYRIKGAVIALRRGEAELIQIKEVPNE